ncbi:MULTISPECIES: sodium-translocating pyrophosphatase [Fervidicoccus]|uniref:K(+)-insensitive pyrophosphate-energized proton pump n=1 Tax=Fervidicoccus fontis (strain DSM 19380 / JCM 18336 / VKM B-2539 / Kam940) TaxID=1163730 RepID=I0A0S1_FERFK|nr:sodium-translocating pyrophosphatase [Fervidicoccus fontis]AFH42578.1 V-type H(+)-translocating pyrophosphatase [Fervidicoccus fontis Kam940]
MKVLFVYVGLIAGLLGIISALYIYNWIGRQPTGTEKMVEIWKSIREGASAYMKRQLKTIIVFSFIMAVIAGISVYIGYDVKLLPQHPEMRSEVISESILIAVSVVLGSASSVTAAFLSMDASTKANVRTTEAARRGTWEALRTAVLGGSVLGFLVPSMSVFMLSLLYLVYSFFVGGSNPLSIRIVLDSLAGFAFGASLSALFAQVGGGIYTKAADMGADLVGKVEAGIPEDDPRNPAVIADQVGDNVGDCAGRGADIFESITAELLGSMIVGWAVYFILINAGTSQDTAIKFMLLPLLIGAVKIISTIPGVVTAASQKKFNDPIEPMRNGVIVTAVVALIGFAIVYILFFRQYWGYLLSESLIGIISAVIIVLATNYYTGRESKAVVEIAQVSQSSSALTILKGLTIGMRATFVPIIVISSALLIAFMIGMHMPLPSTSNSLAIAGIPIEKFLYGIFGTALATLGMLSLSGIIMTLDGAGPISDNAGGIAEMAGLEEEVRNRLDPLDVLGNVTKALTKGFAMGSASLAALLLFQAFVQDYVARDPSVIQLVSGIAQINMQNFLVIMQQFINRLVLIRPDIMLSFLIGAMIPYLFSSFALDAVTRAAWMMVEEVRRQFKERPGILEWKEKPDYYRAVDISTQYAIRNMISPALTVILPPLVIGILFGGAAVGALVVGATASAVTLAILMMWGGAAWDNAKKYIEAGHFGGKKSPAHAAAVVGDTVGDPLKDTAGPSLHIVIKLLNTISLVFIPIYMIWLLSSVLP